MRALLVVCCAAALSGCGDNQAPAAADELWTRIHADAYRGWARAPGYEARRPSAGPHGDEVDIYVNETIASAMAEAKPLSAWPDGALIVKDGFDGADLVHVAVMEKRGSAWFWAEYDGDGDAKYSGSPAVCTDCHEVGPDSVRSFGLPK